MSEASTLGTIATHIGRLFSPLRAALSSEDAFFVFCRRLGFNVTTIPTEYQALVAKVTAVIDAIEADDLDALTKALFALGGAVGAGLPSPDGLLNDQAGKALVDLLVTDYLQSNLPTVFSVLRAIGVVETTFVPAQGGSPGFVKKHMNYDKIPDFLSSPTDVVKTAFKWGVANFSFSDVLEALLQFLLSRGYDAHLERPDLDLMNGYVDAQGTGDANAALHLVLAEDFDANGPIEIGFKMLELPPPNAGFVLQPLIPSHVDLAFANDIHVIADSNVGQTFGLVVRPATDVSLRYPFAQGTPNPTATLSVEFAPSDAKVLLGSASGTRLEVKGAGATAGAAARGGGKFEFLAGVKTVGLKLVVDEGDGDGFLATLLSGQHVEVPLDLGLQWSSESGISFGASGKFEIAISTNLTLGPIHISSLTIAVSGRPADATHPAAALVVGAGADLAATIGPVACTVTGIGVELDLGFGDGNLGPFQLDVGFKSPDGVGIAVNSGPVHGGGFLSLKDGSYSGALELSIYDIAVKAFGLIETKVPGVDFSFVIVISAEFTAIQLGFGFTLNGVGGLVGINRTVDSKALADLVRAGQSEELLFPKNLIQNAPTIIRDLATVFPARQGHYVFGPLAKLGWGTPTLITGELGIILEIPGPVVVLLGEVKCLLPKPEAALVKMNLSIGGTLDFPNKKFSLDAMLHDSIIEGYPISGQMAFRLGWGEQPNFALSIGGFHPAYQPPKDFPKLQPMALDLGQHGSASITVSGFFAVTSNTVQVGGDARLHAGGSGISLDASVGVKALFVFSPFHFAANIDASVKISFHGHGPSVHLSGTLEGPSPWHIKGEVCVSILFWDACLGFNETFGGGDAQPSVPELDPWDPSQSDGTLIGLKAALQDAANWSGVLPGGTANVISRAQGTEALVDPLGGLSVHQKAVPVETDQPISRFGVAKVTNPIPYVLQGASFGSGVTLKKLSANKDFFAPAQYFQMDDGKKLSSSGFEQRQSGYVFGENDNNVRAGSSAPKTLTYDTFLIAGDGTISPAPVPSYDTVTNEHVAGVSKRGAVALFGATQSGTRRFIDRLVTQAFQVNQPTFVLSSTSALTALGETAGGIKATTRSAALLALDAFRNQNPAQRLQVQVSANHELA